MTNEEWGKIAYNAYCENRNWKSFNGDDLPNWESVKPDIQMGWIASAEAVVKHEAFFIDDWLKHMNIDPARVPSASDLAKIFYRAMNEFVEVTDA